jgi:hypothetical protein
LDSAGLASLAALGGKLAPLLVLHLEVEVGRLSGEPEAQK